MRSPSIVPLALALAAAAAHGQTNLETNAGIQFNFSTPGAANLAMGGAFLAVVDDATAAYTNPAGLSQVRYRELHIEGRAFNFTHVYTNDGQLVDPEITVPSFDTLDVDLGGLNTREANDGTAGASFLAYVHPHKKWTFALYRHELARFQAEFDTFGARLLPTRGRSPLGIPGELDGRLAALQNSMDLRIFNYGVSSAWRVHDRLSLGAGISYYDFSLASEARRRVPPLEEEADPAEDPVVNIQRQDGDDGDLGYSLGLHWESPNGRWRAGGVFRDGPSFSLKASSERGPETPFKFAESEVRTRFHVPRFYGVGLAYLPNDAARITLDYDRVTYSDLTRGFSDIFGLDKLFEDIKEDDDRKDVSRLLRGFVIDDADEIHLGFEYYFLDLPYPVAVRAGAWYDPDHQLRFERERLEWVEGTDPVIGASLAYQAVFQGGSDEIHYTFGIGVSRKSYQVHFAVDVSERISTGALSLIYHF